MLPVSSILGLTYFASESVIAMTKRSKGGTGGGKDRGSFAVLWLGIPISIFLAFQFQFQFPAAAWPHSDLNNLLGAAVLIAGLALRWYAIVYLGRFFTVDVAIAADHQLIDTGPYRRVRHPAYTGALLGFIGLGISMQNSAALAVLVIGTTLCFLYRIHVEEAALTGAFGERYLQYRQRSWRLIPGAY